jgi:hypothetical protein
MSGGVLTSRDDQTAHPQGSKQVTDGLRHARLVIGPHGDRASLFRANDPAAAGGGGVHRALLIDAAWS